MRSALSSHLNEFVLCRGWISFWEEIPEYSTRRVVVSQPTIKKADINLLYKDQKFISTEHHLNLFIKHEDLPNYEIVFELNEIINFIKLLLSIFNSEEDLSWSIKVSRIFQVFLRASIKWACIPWLPSDRPYKQNIPRIKKICDF